MHGDDDNADAGIPIPDLVLAAVEGAVNALLALDPESAQRLLPIQGRVLLVELTGFGTRTYVVPGESGLLLYGAYDAEPDCIVRGTPLALARMARGEYREDAVFTGDIEIDGDNRVAQTLGEVIRGLDIDWEELLSKVFGDTIAHRLGLQAQAGRRWARRTGAVLAGDLRDYLQEESRLLPGSDEIRAFIDAVDNVRDDVARLEARLERLVAGQRNP